MRIVIVIPSYNAALTIEKVFERIPKKVFDRVFKFVIVNDGSKDETQKVAEKIKKKYKKVDILVHKKNKGFMGATTSPSISMTITLTFSS